MNRVGKGRERGKREDEKEELTKVSLGPVL